MFYKQRKVKTKMFHQTLFKPLRYVFKSKIFKSRSIAEKDEAEKRLKSAEANKKEILSKYE